MKRMTSKEKIRWNKLSANRHRRDLKRRPRVKALILAQRKINTRLKREELLRALRAKYSNRTEPEGNIL